MSFITVFKGYSVIFKQTAKKNLRAIPVDKARIIQKKIDQLVEGAENLDVLKLANYKFPTYRLRVGVYRVFFEVQEREIILLVIKVEHRKDAYLGKTQ